MVQNLMNNYNNGPRPKSLSVMIPLSLPSAPALAAVQGEVHSHSVQAGLISFRCFHSCMVGCNEHPDVKGTSMQPEQQLQEKKKVSLFRRERQEAQGIIPAAAVGPTPAAPLKQTTPPAQGHANYDPSESSRVDSKQQQQATVEIETLKPRIPPEDVHSKTSGDLLESKADFPLIESDHETLDQKIDRYHRFVEETLRVRLEKVLGTRGQVVKSIEEHEKLLGTVELLKERKENHVKTMINMGCDLYMQTSIPDTSRISVCVGLGIYAEFTLPEAAEFINKKCEHLHKRADQLSHTSSEISSQIEVVLRGIQELMSIPDPVPNQKHFL